MNAPRTHLDYVRDIVAMMTKIEMFTRGLEFDEFVRDHKTYLATVQALESGCSPIILPCHSLSDAG